MVDYKKRIVYGFSNIYIANINDDGTYGTPVELPGGKKIELTYDVKSKDYSADDNIVVSDSSIAKADGKLSLFSLTIDEQAMLFGGENMSGGYAVGTDTSTPDLAILFERKKLDGSKLLYSVYKANFKQTGISATSVEGGEKEEQILEIEFTATPVTFDDKPYLLYAVDSGDTKADTDMVSKWFIEVQKPKKTVAKTVSSK